MNKQLFLVLIYFSCLMVFKAQSQTAPPEGINYQAVAVDETGKELVGIDAKGQPVSNSAISVRFSIIKDMPAGMVAYREKHSTTTDNNGLFNLVIGQGDAETGFGTFAQIDWGTGFHFLKVELDLNGGDQFKDMGTQQLWSVPYALYAKKAGNGIASVTDNGDGTLTFTYIDGSTYTTGVLTGLTGPQGPAGAAGIPGQNGLSAYELWLAEGNSGTEADFLSSLVGVQGPQGLQGAQGSTGSQGPTGPTGAQGPSGTNGVGITSTVDNGNGTFTIHYSDGTSFTTSNLTGPQGAAGPTGPAGECYFSRMQVYATAGTYTFTIPSGVTKIMVEVWGGGGGGGNGSTATSGWISSGGAGGYGKEILTVAAGNSYTVIVGSGGTSGGGIGGNSSFGSLISATGGTGGMSIGTYQIPVGGTSSATFNISGGQGVWTGTSVGWGATGAASYGGAGGAGAANGISSTDGCSPGGGGGSGCGTAGYITGGKGGGGRVVVWY